ncbi:hypothetical protein [Methylobacterium sp. JK268]
MVGFWDALESATHQHADFDTERQRRFRKAEDRANAFFGEMQRHASRLEGFGVTVRQQGQTISFRRGGLELLAITFGTTNGTENRIFSPVIEHLKLTPSFQDLPADEDLQELAGQWLGRSIEAVQNNVDRFRALGVI